ncbi:Uncharacterised protein [Neisseria zoodegmatis]|uniref:Uncharacterized protein n=1 Tax=Neisseria zoodegmatis TaxID=326523 RepID=A0AB38DPZ1_9NEIS|nr:hypothetical protein BWD10_08130 [Neisseria zoodegmatis]SNU79474.1 Uncharacterised protein [Neisseria zoodegmatis]
MFAHLQQAAIHLKGRLKIICHHNKNGRFASHQASLGRKSTINIKFMNLHNANTPKHQKTNHHFSYKPHLAFCFSTLFFRRNLRYNSHL